MDTSEPKQDNDELEGIMPQASQHGSSTFESILHNQQLQMEALINLLNHYLGWSVESESIDNDTRLVLDGD